MFLHWNFYIFQLLINWSIQRCVSIRGNLQKIKCRFKSCIYVIKWKYQHAILPSLVALMIEDATQLVLGAGNFRFKTLWSAEIRTVSFIPVSWCNFIAGCVLEPYTLKFILLEHVWPNRWPTRYWYLRFFPNFHQDALSEFNLIYCNTTVRWSSKSGLSMKIGPSHRGFWNMANTNTHYHHYSVSQVNNYSLLMVPLLTSMIERVTICTAKLTRLFVWVEW